LKKRTKREDDDDPGQGKLAQDPSMKVGTEKRIIV